MSFANIEKNKIVTKDLNVQERLEDDSDKQQEVTVNLIEEEMFDEDAPAEATTSKRKTERSFHTMELGRIIRDSEFDDASLENKRKQIDEDCTALCVNLTPDHQKLVLTIALSVDPAKKNDAESFLQKAKTTFGLDLEQHFKVKGVTNRGATLIHRVKLKLFEWFPLSAEFVHNPGLTFAQFKEITKRALGITEFFEEGWLPTIALPGILGGDKFAGQFASFNILQKLVKLAECREIQNTVTDSQGGFAMDGLYMSKYANQTLSCEVVREHKVGFTTSEADRLITAHVLSDFRAVVTALINSRQLWGEQRVNDSNSDTRYVAFGGQPLAKDKDQRTTMAIAKFHKRTLDLMAIREQSAHWQKRKPPLFSYHTVGSVAGWVKSAYGPRSISEDVRKMWVDRFDRSLDHELLQEDQFESRNMYAKGEKKVLL